MRGRRASEVYHRHDPLGLEDRSMEMDCYFWLIRSGSGVTLVDCGWDRSAGLRGISPEYRHIDVDETDPVELLARVGVAPGDVDRVIVSHMHFDHVGNLGLFPDATLVMARAEYDCWTGPPGHQPVPAHPVSRAMSRPSRSTAVGAGCSSSTVARRSCPGFWSSRSVGTHPGQLLVEVSSPTGTVVLASDAIHFHEEVEENRPFYVFSDTGELLDAYTVLRAKASTPRTWVVSGHDPLEMSRFERVDDHCVGLTKPTFALPSGGTR